MSLAPLLDAAPAIPLHAFAAMAAFVLGVVQFAAPKGTLPHRTLGWIWVCLMMAVALSSFWIHQIRLVGPWSPIHLLSIFTLVMLPLGVWRAHHHQVARSSPHHDLDFHRRAGDRRAVHAGSGADHARGRFRPLARLRKAGSGKRFSRTVPAAVFGVAATRCRGPRKSLEKRREKPLCRNPFRVVLKPPMRYMILEQELTGFPLCLTLKISQARRAAGAFRYSSRIHPRRDEALLSRLRHERDRGACAARCARRSQAGASAHPLLDVRAGPHAGQEVRQVRARRRRRDR